MTPEMVELIDAAIEYGFECKLPENATKIPLKYGFYLTYTKQNRFAVHCVELGRDMEQMSSPFPLDAARYARQEINRIEEEETEDSSPFFDDDDDW